MNASNNNDHLRDRIAHEFTRILKDWLPVADWLQVVSRNAEEQDSNICHSHDFCDANMAMAEAFEKVVGRECVANDDADIALMGAAWDEANRIWQAEASVAPAPTTVREMTDKDCEDYAVDRADYPNDRLWLAIWPDRSGYYTEGKDSPPDEARYCATVLNESEIFAISEEAQAWLWARLDTSTPPNSTEPSKPAPVVTKRLSLTFTTFDGRRLLGPDLDAVRRNGDHPNLERYFDEAGTAELICSTAEREECEAAGPHTEDSDTLNATDFAALASWMLENANLRLESIRAEDRT